MVQRVYLVLLLAWNDFLIRLESRVGVIFVVAVPLAMTLITGLAFKGFEPRNIEGKVALEDHDHGAMADKFREAMNKMMADPNAATGKAKVLFLLDPLDHAEAVRRIQDKKLTGVLVLPEGMTRKLQAGEPSEISLLVSPNQNLERAVVEGTVDRLVQRVRQEHPLPLEWQTQTEGKAKLVEGFSSWTQAVAGNGVMFILLNCIVMGGMTLVREKRQNTLARLLISPLRPGMIILGKTVGVYIVGLIQALVIFGFGAVVGVFAGLSAGGILGVVLVTLTFILVGCALGLTISALARREENVESMGVPAALLMTALGGGMFPVEMSPDWMQKIVKLFPTGWAMEGYHKLMWEGEAWTAILPDLGVMVLFALVFLGIGIRYLRWD